MGGVVRRMVCAVVVAVVVVAGCGGSGGLDGAARRACGTWAELSEDIVADVLTEAEFRARARVVYDQARGSRSEDVAPAAAALLASLTGPHVPGEVGRATKRLVAACDGAPQPVVSAP